jgi:serine/threonine protein kinase
MLANILPTSLRSSTLGWINLSAINLINRGFSAHRCAAALHTKRTLFAMGILFATCGGEPTDVPLLHGAANWQQGKRVRVGDYDVRVVRLVAQGAYSDAFEVALESDLDAKTLCLKRTRLMSADAERAFTRERKALQRFGSDKDGVAPLLSWSIDDDGAGTVRDGKILMPLYACTLQRYVRDRMAANRPLSMRQVVRLALQICRGLARFHQGDTAIRDLKPANVLMTRAFVDDDDDNDNDDGDDIRCVLVDFGSVGDARERVVSSRAEAIEIAELAEAECTACYRAPELWEVDVGAHLDARSDMFSFGLLLCFMAFGSSPIEDAVTAGGSIRLAIMAGLPRQLNAYAHESFDARFTEFLRQLCAIDIRQRPAAAQALETLESLSESATSFFD